ncbi:iron ABC transporter ATP-binding protein [Nocardioides sp. GXZ039]|uniref:iron ABC transporter ATP-binding protein n=1 Tax=Nocardioides sp. GXZ039 TaxID=3136018 RepID=UPI0030F3A190
MITVSSVSHSYDDTSLVLDDVDLTLPRGALTALIGPNGAGKSTLLSAMARLLSPDQGAVRVDDLDVLRAKPDVVARKLAVLRQDNHLTARLTVVDLVRFGRFPYSKGHLDAEDHEIVERSLDYLQLGEFRDRHLDELSGGQRQRAFIAMVLAQDTDYVLLDEPLNNLDLRHAAAMMQLLRQAATELRKTVVVVLHDINFAAAYADHIVAMKGGAVMATGSPAELMRTEVLRPIFDLDIEVHEIGGRRVCLYWHPEPATLEAPARDDIHAESSSG